MKPQRNIKWLSVIFLLIYISTVSIACWGSPVVDIVIENQTKYILTIYIDKLQIGEVSPSGRIIKTKVPLDIGEYVIEAKNKQGKTIFSETYSYKPENEYHLQELDEKHEGAVKVYLAIIPPLEELGTSDNITTNER